MTPRYEVVLQTGLRVPMRDGVELATDVYRPSGSPDKLSSILIRTKYGKADYRLPEPSKPVAMMFAAQGYAVVVQELRGLFDSGGHFALLEHDAKDGYDTLSWIASQPWSTERVGTYGCSALGITQVLTAQLCHPAHRCAIVEGAGGAMSGDRQRLGVSFREVVHSDRTEETGVTTLQHPSEGPNEHPQECPSHTAASR
ncbi:CocE/NonD family hydrolase, partial [Mesorhizobium sp. M1A.F.Ca.IN.022.05.2.1]|uniref:CocE/NonD family hydrolase n=4 Tax=unclassified Mesorhizobium TaxID=325217 RepID=UPI0013E08358